MADAEREQKAIDRPRARILDGGEQVARRGLAPALAVLQALELPLLLALEAEDVGRLAHLAEIVERLDLLLAEPLDVHRVARHEMAEPLDLLRRADQAAGAAAHDLALLAHRMAAADRADGREFERLRVRRPLLQHHRDDLRDDVARALHDHGVADADVLARDLVLVVQRGVGDHHAAHGDGLELGDRRQRTGAADLDVDLAQHGRRLLGGEFVGDGPARRARLETEATLQIEVVDLVDDAVDVIAERGALLADLAVIGDHLLGRVHDRSSADW